MIGRAAIATCALAASCHPPPLQPHEPAPRSPAASLVLAELTGTWEWRLESDEPGVHRIERERWHLAPAPSTKGALRAVGAYDRDVEIRSSDGVPFACDQEPVYHQRARFQVEAAVTDDRVTITETGYAAEPSPCDHGYRKAGSYAARVTHDAITLVWDGGQETLRRAAADAPLPARPDWPGAAPRWDGAWTWTAHTMDDDGNLRDEREDWQLALGDGGAASATYVRTVTTTSIDGRPITCAGTRRWSYVDRYVLDGHLDGPLLTLTEVAADPGTHPCLTPTPTRALDALTAETDGEYLELEWRGKRRQVLHRPR